MNTRIYAIIPAAGRSRRMGRAKQLIDVDGRPMLEVVVAAIFDAGVFEIIVVTRSDIMSALTASLGGRAAMLVNDEVESEMIDSIRIGIAHLRRVVSLNAVDGILICPGDLWRLTAGDVRACINAFFDAPDRIIIASYDGHRGHPLILPVEMCDAIESPLCDRGLNALPRHHCDRVMEVPCRSAGVIRDADRPGDLQDPADGDR